MPGLQDVRVEGVTEVEEQSVDDVGRDADDADVPEDEEEDEAEVEAEEDPAQRHQQQDGRARRWTQQHRW